MSSFNTTFLLVSILFIGLASARSVEQRVAAKDLISDVCSLACEPAVCEAVRRSNPGSAKADLRGLAHISITLSRKSATLTLKLIDALSKEVRMIQVLGGA